MKNDLKHLRRSELIDLIYEMKKREIELQTRLDEAEAKLQAREITMEKAGSIADAAVQLSGVFQAAQKAADTYLKSIKAKEKEFVFCQVLFPEKSVGIPFFQQGIFPAFSGHYASLRMRACSIR